MDCRGPRIAFISGGIFVSYVPTALQLKTAVQALPMAHQGLEAVDLREIAMGLQVKGMSVRPVHRMIAHRASVIVARRLAPSADGAAPAPDRLPDSAPVEPDDAPSEDLSG